MTKAILNLVLLLAFFTGYGQQQTSFPFQNTSNANTVTVQSGTTSPSYALTLPTAQGAANTALINDGSGNLSFGTGRFPTVPFKSVSSSSAVTGTVAETITDTVAIPANTFAVGNFIRFEQRMVKTGVIGGMTMREYFNTDPNLSGATLAATSSNAGTTILFNQSQRIFNISASNSTKGWAATLTATTDYNSTATAGSNLAIDWTVKQYYIITIQPGSTLDAVYREYYLIKKE